ncbi:MAG: HYR domain-containing protein, partial [Candidatus Nitrosopelagicus sp.]|nr:HYR domain-containing protein [Candidatus Nitrosopelagicus sp.]
MVVLFAIGLYAVPNAFAYTISDDATGGDCSTIGTWDSGSNTCTLTSNLDVVIEEDNSNIQITSDNITLDGNGFTLAGTSGVSHHTPAIMVFSVHNTIVKNFVVEGEFSKCIGVGWDLGGGGQVKSTFNVVKDNTLNCKDAGVSISTGAENTTVQNNSVNSPTGVIVSSAYVNEIIDNDFSNTNEGIRFGAIHNIPVHIFSGNIWSDFDEPDDGCYDDNSNGFCDDPYVFSVGQDDTPKCTICELQPPADVIFPVIIVPNNITIQATNSTSSSVTFSVTATDDTDGNLNPSCTQSSGSNFPIGTTTVTCTVADVAGNSSSKSFTVTVLYDEPEPTVEEPIIENAISTTTIQNAQGSSVPGCEPDCYIPRIASVEHNDVVTFENNDSAAHTTTSGTPSDGPNGIWDSSLMMKGQSFSIRLSDVGEYPYFCLVHPWMIGTILVVDGERVPQTGFVSVNESVYEIQYNSQNVEINSIT